MKVAYVFSTSGHTASYKLGKMILPQLEQGNHGVEVVGMMFFDDNTYLLRQGDPIGERLARVAAEQGMLLMMCDQCALERGLAEGEIGSAVPEGDRRRRAGGLLPGSVRRAGRQSAGPGHHAVGDRVPARPCTVGTQLQRPSVSALFLQEDQTGSQLAPHSKTRAR